MTVVDAIKEILFKRKWSQADLAEECNFSSQGAISNAFARKNGMRTDNLLKMAKALGCEVVIRDKMVKGQEWIITMESDEDAQ